MATVHRKRASDIANLPVPKLPQIPPAAWPAGLYQVLRDLLRALEITNDVIFGIQDNGTKEPLRSDLNFVGASVTDDLANDRTTVSIGGGAGAAPVNATYLVVSLNGTLSDERVAVAGNGLTSTDGGAGGNFTLNVGAGTGITSNANDVAITNTAVTPAAYGDATHVGAFTVNQQGQLTAAASVAITYPVPTIVGAVRTVATLPVAPPQGTRAWVTDATAPVFLTPLVGLGAVVCPAFYDGTNWVAA